MSSMKDMFIERLAARYCDCPPGLQDVDGDAESGYWCAECGREVECPDMMDYAYGVEVEDRYELYQET